MIRLAALLALLALTAPAASVPIDVTVTEGTSMSVTVSPDRRTLAIDLQGSVWTLPAAGGAATRITDVFSDARQPAWSPDGKSIAFFAYRDGGYDLWAAAPDGSNLRKLTWGPFDDREPAWSHDGTRVAFSSDRGDPLGSDYNIWLLDLRSGALRQLTTDPSEDYMPSWSPDDSEIAFASTRESGQAVWAVNVGNGSQRKLATARGTVDAPSWGPGGQIVYHVLASGQSRLEVDGNALTGGENAFPFRAAWISPTDFLYVSDGKIRKRALPGLRSQEPESGAGDDRIPRDPAGDASRLRAPQARLRFHRPASRPRHRQASDLAGRIEGRLRRGRRHLRDADRRQAGERHARSRARHRSRLVARRIAARLLVRQGQRSSAALDARRADRSESPRHQSADAAAGRHVVARW